MLTPSKASRLHIRCDRQVRELLDKAAALAHMSVSEFVLRRAVEEAKAVVAAHESITLKQEDFAAFLAALEEPGEPNAALRRAFARHDASVR
ncbi:MAG: DUF1778 domain-containing protein [Rhodocyclaceae bacterium]|nr:DUF1778 domain-containing protein [Rhodocyclaceae bacterium]